MNVQIVGSGVVGQATGNGLSLKGHKITYVDIDEKVIKMLKYKGYYKKYSVSDIPLPGHEITFVSVPTPTVNNKIVLEYIKTAITSIGKILEKDHYQVVVIRSTVPPGTVENVLIPILEEVSGLTAGKDFGVCMNPEFLRENHALKDFINAPGIVIGEYDERSGDLLEKMYSCFEKAQFIHMSIKAAELVKYTSNVFGALKITYFNIIGEIAESLGISPELVIDTTVNYSHILQNPEYGTVPGRPYAGACFPKDTLSFIEFVKSNGTSKWVDLLQVMDHTNRMIAQQYKHTIKEYQE